MKNFICILFVLVCYNISVNAQNITEEELSKDFYEKFYKTELSCSEFLHLVEPTELDYKLLIKPEYVEKVSEINDYACRQIMNGSENKKEDKCWVAKNNESIMRMIFKENVDLYDVAIGVEDGGVYFLSYFALINGNWKLFLTPMLESYIDDYDKFEKERMKEDLSYAQMDIPLAQIGMGQRYVEGKGVDKNYEKAKYWFEKAASNGCSLGYSSLAGMREAGYLGDIEPDSVISYHLKAAFLEDKYSYKSQSWLGSFYYFLYKNKGCSIEESIKWYLKAANSGSKVAQYELGKILQEKGGYENLREAKRWFIKSAEQGYEDARKALSDFTEK